MSFYALAALINGIISVILGVFVFMQNKRDIRYITYALFCFAVFTWSCFYFEWQVTSDENVALLCSRGLMAGAIFIPVTYLHHILVFFNIYTQKKKIIYYGYLSGFCFLLSDFTSLFVAKVTPRLVFKFWPVPGILFHPFLILWGIYVVYGMSIIISEYMKSTGFRKNQLKYVLLATFIGWSGGATNYPLWYNVPILPFGNILVSGYMLILAYSILRYRLMDISVAITRTGIFIAVYTLVLGFPFAVALWLKSWLIGMFATDWWMAPLVLMAILSTAGPFIYIYLERKAEARLLREQRRYQSILKQASLGMTRIRNLQKLLNLITHIVTKTVKITYAAIYIYDKNTEEYILQVSRDHDRVAIPKLTHDNPLMSWLVSKRRVLVYEEVKRRMQDTNDAKLKKLEENMRLLYASVIIPSILEDKFMGFIVLGEKMSGQIYTNDDLNVFEVLASQAALAIENAQFYEEAKEMQDQISQAEKMATIGTMADGLSHQINNRFYALSLIAGDSIDTIKMTDTSKCTPEVQHMIEDVSKALDRIQTNVVQGGEVVRGMLKYSRRGEEGFEPLELNKILDGTLEMVQFKVKLSELDIVRNFNHIPKINGNMAQLEEVFFNFIDNANDAITERKQTIKDENYRGRIMISANPKAENILEIIVEDNGIGVKEEDFKKVFTPFFTTKSSSRKGTGLGLYVIRRIINEVHKGKIQFNSQYKIGTKFIVELPIAKEIT